MQGTRIAEPQLEEAQQAAQHPTARTRMVEEIAGQAEARVREPVRGVDPKGEERPAGRDPREHGRDADEAQPGIRPLEARTASAASVASGGQRTALRRGTCYPSLRAGGRLISTRAPVAETSPFV